MPVLPANMSLTLALLFCFLLPLSLACSNFAMEDSFKLSVRTEDMGPIEHDFGLIAQPAVNSSTSHTSKRGFLAFALLKHPELPPPLDATQGIKAGLNDAGLSCDKQTLRPTTFPNASHTLQNIDAALLCRWALEGFGNVEELKVGLKDVNFVHPAEDSNFNDGHFALRDADGRGVVIEFVDGVMNVYDDNNDNGITGFGIMTNEPAFPWQVEGIRHLQWKLAKAHPAVEMPGSWYPDSRFQRIYLIKSTMPKVEDDNLQAAVGRAVQVLNTVTVPTGQQIGKDSGKPKGGSLPEDHKTYWGVIYDHINRAVYWRTDSNQNLQRVRLQDAGVQVGGEQRVLLVTSRALPWYNDAAAAFGSRSEMKSGSDSLHIIV